VLTADIRHAAWAAAQAAVALGELPVMIGPADPSTLRPTKSPTGYASTLPYFLATPAVPPPRVAAVLASHLTSLPWIASTTATTGHLVITVTDDALGRLAVRIPTAPDCAASDILRGLTIPVTAEITAKLGRKAGAFIDNERLARGSPPAWPALPMGQALDYAGPDIVRYALISAPRGWQPRSVADLPVRYHRANPVYAVRYAHAHAVSTLRQAADLGLGRGDAAEFVPRLLGHPLERALLGAMSWLPERVAWAARRGQPGEFARYLAELADAYHDCREHCPALPFGGHSAPRDPGTTRARLWLVTAAKTAIAAGLDLLGVSAPDRL
jgi:DALR anticodon binding domain